MCLEDNEKQSLLFLRPLWTNAFGPYVSLFSPPPYPVDEGFGDYLATAIIAYKIPVSATIDRLQYEQYQGWVCAWGDNHTALCGFDVKFPCATTIRS